jgi:hypothetical protein
MLSKDIPWRWSCLFFAIVPKEKSAAAPNNDRRIPMVPGTGGT